MRVYRKLIILLAAVLGFGLLVALPMLSKLSDPKGLRPGFDSEFLVRPDGYAGLKEAYGFEFEEIPLHMDPGLMYKAVSQGLVDVICGFATDGRIPAYDLVTLEDDQSFFPPYQAASLVRKETLLKYPELEAICSRLAGRISNAQMRRLNFQVDEDGMPPEAVARAFLIEEDLISEEVQDSLPPEGIIRVGGKNFTEQEILGEIIGQLVEAHSRLRVDRKLNLGGTMICFNALLAGDLDLYVEYTGTALVSILKKEAISDPARSFNLVRKVFAEQYELSWLEPLGFNNTYTLTMRRVQSDRLGIRSISDLARFVNQAKEE